MKPLKVLILITKANWGGAQRHVFDLAKGLPREQFAVEVMAGSEGPLISKLKEIGIPASGDLELGRDIKLGRDWKAFFHLISMLRKKKPDILHLHSSKIGGLGALAGRLAGVKKVIFTAHGWAFNENRPAGQKMLIRFFAWLTMIFAHETIAVSNTAKRQVSGWPFIQDKMSVVYNGISRETGFSKQNARLELARLNPSLKKAVEGVPEKDLYWIGTIAELHHIKGHKYAIQAVADCIRSLERNGSSRKIVYTIVGAGEEKEKLEGLIKKLGLEDQIFLMGYVPLAVQYVKAFDIFMLASLSEALGYVLLEAGAAEVPIVATSVGGIPEIIDDMHTGILVQPRNSQDLSHALRFSIDHDKESREYAAHLRQKIDGEFSLEKMIGSILRIYTGQ